MTYDYSDYWLTRGKTTESPRVSFVAQESVLLTVLADLRPESVLDVGCGWGRIGVLIDGVTDYRGIELSPERVERCRRAGLDVVQADLFEYAPEHKPDLVLCTEVLMHLPPGLVGEAVTRLLNWGPMVSVDWNTEKANPAAHNFRHDYEALGAQLKVQVGEQGVYLWEQG